MHKNSIMRRLLALIIPLALLGLMLLASCEKEKVVEIQKVVHDTIAVEIINVSGNDSVAQGGQVTLTADITIPSGYQVGTLVYNWFSTGGTFNSTTGDTVVWKAPENVGAYEISVHVVGGQLIGLGLHIVGVGMYVPYQIPYYVGASICSGCHAGTYDSWSQTGHAGAWATLQASGHPAPDCNPCHTVGFEGPLGNSGYDEAPIAKFENVQCENCHGPASGHTNITNAPAVDWSAENCGTCHEGTHHPYLSEWKESAHNSMAEAAETNCQGCHEGVAAGKRLSGDLSTFYRSGAISSRPDTTEAPLQPMGCTTCHDSHNAEHTGQLRTDADVVLVSANGETNPVISDGGVGKLCMQCHHARNAPESHIQNGNSRFGPHGSPQGDMLAAKSANLGVAPEGFEWAQPSHLYVQNSCKTCHLNRVEYESDLVPAKTGHTFEPTVAACSNCHGTITSFKDIKALQDFDGDHNVEGVQDEVQGLMDNLKAALILTGLDTTGGLSMAEALGDTNNSTLLQREAGFNLIFVESDGSLGIHNPDYAVQLLQQSYLHLMDNKVPGAVILTAGRKAVAMNW
jgi:predicted CXXCH cytochrome family protein